MDRSLNQLGPLKKKTELLIKQSVKQKDLKSAQIYAKELINIRRQYDKLHLSKTRVDSIAMVINEQWQLNKLTQSMHLLTGVMKDVNLLIHVGAVLQTMQELSKELTKAGIIDEMMTDMMDLEEEDLDLELESQEEINKIIETATQDKFSKIQEDVPKAQLPEEPVVEAPAEEDEEDEQTLDEMRERLKALQE